jgi:hypothetical protein
MKAKQRNKQRRNKRVWLFQEAQTIIVHLDIRLTTFCFFQGTFYLYIYHLYIYIHARLYTIYSIIILTYY